MATVFFKIVGVSVLASLNDAQDRTSPFSHHPLVVHLPPGSVARRAIHLSNVARPLQAVQNGLHQPRMIPDPHRAALTIERPRPYTLRPQVCSDARPQNSMQLVR